MVSVRACALAYMSPIFQNKLLYRWTLWVTKTFTIKLNISIRFLREQDLENYIAELIHTLPQLDGLEKSFHNFYTCTATRKFFFFLDPMRTGKIRIMDILACSFLDELLELRDQDLAKEVQEANWFSAPSALRVYGEKRIIILDNYSKKFWVLLSLRFYHLHVLLHVLRYLCI